MTSLPHRVRTQTIKTPKEEVVTLEQKCNESKHHVVREGDRIHCSMCLDSFRIEDPACQHWLAGLCLEVTSSSPDVPPLCLPPRPQRIPISKGAIHVGNQTIHHSHRLLTHRGLRYCRKCGYVATNMQTRKLAKPCEPPKQYGRNIKRSIQKDEIP